MSYECDGQEAKREVNLLGINDAEERFETKATSVRIFPIKQNEQKLVTWTETIDSRLIVLRFREKRCVRRGILARAGIFGVGKNSTHGTIDVGSMVGVSVVGSSDGANVGT